MRCEISNKRLQKFRGILNHAKSHVALVTQKATNHVELT